MVLYFRSSYRFIQTWCLIILALTLSNHVVGQADSSHSVPKGKPIVQVFGNTFFNLSDQADQRIRFAIGRAHLGYQYQFDKRFSFKILLDRGRPTSIDKVIVKDSAGNYYDVSTAVKDGSYYTMTLKFATLAWQANEKLRIEGGGILQNNYITQEKFWKYRYVAQTFQDRYYHIPSGDLGFIAYYKFNKVIGIDFAVTNGEGFRVDQDVFGKVKLAGGIDVYPIDNFQIRFYYHNKSFSDSISNQQEQLFSFFTGYKFGTKARLGLEYNYMKDFSNIAGLNAYGLSVYGDITIFKNTTFFARFDELNYDYPTSYTESTLLNDKYAIITGLSYTPVHNVDISLNYKGFIPKEKDLITTSFLALDFAFKL